MVGFTAQRPMELGVEGLTGAGHGERSYAQKLVTGYSGGAFDLLDPVFERHSLDDFGDLI